MSLRTAVIIVLMISFLQSAVANDVRNRTITDLSCDLKIEFHSRYLQSPTTIFAKVYTKRPGGYLLFIHGREPYANSSVFPFEPMGLALLMANGTVTRYQLLSHDNWKAEVRADEEAPRQFNVMEMHRISIFDSVLQSILSVDFDDYFREDLPGEIRLTRQNRAAVLWGHKISEIRCRFAADTECLEHAEYYDVDGKLVCELKASKPVRLHTTKWVPTEIVMTVSEGRCSVYNSDLTLTVRRENYFQEERTDGEIPYPAGGLIIHRNFEVFDQVFLCPSETKFYTGKRELTARSVFSNYRINRGIDDEVFDEKNLLAGVGIAGVRGELLRARIAFASAKRGSADASSYDGIIPVVTSLASSDDTPVAVDALYHQARVLIQQQKYEQAVETILTLSDKAGSEDEYGHGWASGTAAGLATEFIEHGQVALAQDILDKFVEHAVKDKWDILAHAKQKLTTSHYFHGIKLYEFISRTATEIETKVLCQFAITCCYDMIARESIDASTWYRTDDEKRAAVEVALERYGKFIAAYPTSRYAPWATHYSAFLAAYPTRIKPQHATASPEALEKHAGKVASDVRTILHAKRQKWTALQIDAYAKNVESAFRNALTRVLTQREYDDFQNSFTTYCESALPVELNTVDELAIELTTIRWVVRQYVSRLDMVSEVTETAIDWQVKQLIRRFDEFVATYLHDDALEGEISAVKKQYREALNLYRSNAVYPVLKYPLSPRWLWRYEGEINEQEARMAEMLRVHVDMVESAAKANVPEEVRHEISQLAIDEKRDELSWIVRLWVGSLSRAYKTIFPDEFHPETKKVVQYHYLPNGGIKLTMLVDKADYPKLGIDY